MNYYNEIDPYCIHWLDNLIDAGVIPKGVIDTRPIEEIDTYEIRGFTQYHFFAGLGGWSEALRLAGWPEDQPIITGSCPCQPFSCAGKGQGETDPRHLWSFFYRHIAELGISVVVGEQVARRIGVEWFEAVRVDLENLGYVVGGADLCAASASAPHIRQRLFWVAYSDGTRTGRKSGGYSCEKLSLTAWDGSEFLQGSDGLSRPIEPRIFPLANGIPGRLARQRAYGNAIVPQVAAKFVRSAVQAM